ncbi:HlyD family efflux transporter periplasmic adaptor subunit [Desulfofustis glycolicus]|uniref:HlyD family efflux transporter periplasmic adaptor subunit n=1 Tax=Desulfofustis glycolicus TaxID=51195 RepID=UPI001ABF587C|nr:HlyD family efflux transporter periplasmic adaptor subunit [Desulfobulbaceae bacterium]
MLTTSAEIGEFLNPSTPVLIIGALNRPWLRAYINETDLGRVKLNLSVRVTTDSYPRHDLSRQDQFHQRSGGIHSQVSPDFRGTGQTDVSRQDRPDQSRRRAETGYAGRCLDRPSTTVQAIVPP